MINYTISSKIDKNLSIHCGQNKTKSITATKCKIRQAYYTTIINGDKSFT